MWSLHIWLGLRYYGANQNITAKNISARLSYLQAGSRHQAQGSCHFHLWTRVRITQGSRYNPWREIRHSNSNCRRDKRLLKNKAVLPLTAGRPYRDYAVQCHAILLFPQTSPGFLLTTATFVPFKRCSFVIAYLTGEIPILLLNSIVCLTMYCLTYNVCKPHPRQSGRSQSVSLIMSWTCGFFGALAIGWVSFAPWLVGSNVTQFWLVSSVPQFWLLWHYFKS